MLRKLFNRLRSQLRRGKVERDLDRELQFHLEMETAENVRRGMSEEEARRAALLSFGGVERTKEAYRDIARFRRLEDFRQDLRYGARMLFKKPGFTLIAVLTLALGIGANTAIFSVVNGVLLRPLPYKEPDRLARFYSEFPTMNLRKFWISPPEYVDVQKEAKSWESIGAWSAGGVNIAANGPPIRVAATGVTRSLIDTLGVQPAQGRNFTLGEDTVGGPRVAIISHALWQRSFGGQADIVGKQITIDARTFNVVGVMPQGYVFPPGSNQPADILTPFQFDPANPGNRGNHFLNLIGRLKPGTTLNQAR